MSRNHRQVANQTKQVTVKVKEDTTTSPFYIGVGLFFLIVYVLTFLR